VLSKPLKSVVVNKYTLHSYLETL